MIFNSLTYLTLLILLVPIYWLLPNKTRPLLILFTSLSFYSFWRPDFLPLLLFSTGLDWWLSLLMQRKQDNQRFKLLVISVITNLALLFYFKYLIFFADTAVSLANVFGGELYPIEITIILPLGISFYTFQTISYTVDVYRRVITPEKNFIIYACYVTFFPQLVAGPILRASEVIKQFKANLVFSFFDISVGTRRILYGLFLKVVIADNIAPLVDQGFDMSLSTMSALDVWTLAFLFGFQIYFDFSAYSHIAIGSARMFGFVFPENFNFPYISRSPKEFWQRWHISLSSWVRDYLYLPLSGLQPAGSSKEGINLSTVHRINLLPLILTWLLMGLWHGAGWTFVLWGLYHAVLILLYRIFNAYFSASFFSTRWVGFTLTLPLINLGWIPFRSTSLESTLTMWSKVFDPYQYTWLGMRENVYLVAACLLVGFLSTYALHSRATKWASKSKTSFFVADAMVITMITVLVLIFLRPVKQFIYFQF